ncbi:MAG: GerMN domain-containing protein [Candidatus Geothermincolales bacterium]
MNRHSSSIVVFVILTCLLSLLVMASTGCRGKSEDRERGAGEELPAAGREKEETEETTGPENGKEETKTTEVNLYFGVEKNGKLYLKAEKRKVTYQGDLYAAVMRELVRGPSSASGLRPVLPRTTRVLGTRLEEGVLFVDLSKEALLDSPSLGTGAEGEALALASLANTMTELPGVNRVKLLVEGKDKGMVDGRAVEDFWGHVGLPEYLERNESLILE